MNTALVQTKKPPKSNLSASQKTFNRLKKQIEDLQEQLKANRFLLEESLNYYQTILIPAKKIALDYITQCLKIFYPHCKRPSRLTKIERIDLKEIIINKINFIFSENTAEEFDPELCAIFKDLEGVDYKDLVEAGFSSEMELLKEMLESAGLNIDLSNLQADDKPEEALRKFIDSIQEATPQMEDDKPQEKPKTKRQLAKEAKVQELENMQKKGLSTIYKQLAKVLHPDLEYDPVQKKQKEELMKKLTVAYENNDLYGLLSLEIDWINRSENNESNGSLKSDSNLKIYNSILKDQISEIEQSIDLEFFNPRYASIQKYINEFHSPIKLMISEFKDLEADNKFSMLILKESEESNLIRFLKKMLKREKQETFIAMLR